MLENRREEGKDIIGGKKGSKKVLWAKVESEEEKVGKGGKRGGEFFFRWLEKNSSSKF